MGNPYDIDIDKLVESSEITDQEELGKFALIREFLKITKKMSSEEVMDLTGLDKSDLSRIRTLNLKRFSLVRIMKLLSSLGYVTKFKVVKNQEAS